MTAIQTIAPCLWFDGRAEEAAQFYVSLFPDSYVDNRGTCRCSIPRLPHCAPLHAGYGAFMPMPDA